MFFATFNEYFANRKDEWHHHRKSAGRAQEGLFPLIRIFCNVILREMQTFGVISEVYVGRRASTLPTAATMKSPTISARILASSEKPGLHRSADR